MPDFNIPGIIDFLSKFGGPLLGLKLSKWVNMNENEALAEIKEFVQNASISQMKELDDVFQTVLTQAENRPYKRQKLMVYYKHFQEAISERSRKEAQPVYNINNHINNSGNFNLNIASTLGDIKQIVNDIPRGDQKGKDELVSLLQQLGEVLQKAPKEKSQEAELIAEYAKAIIEELQKSSPKNSKIEISKNGLMQAAKNIAAVMPIVLDISQKITSHPMLTG